MSTYLAMWALIKQMTPAQIDVAIERIEPATGTSINFYNLRLLDVDLLEALKNYKQQEL